MTGFYEIADYKDLYRKCKHDYHLLESTRGKEEYSYNLLNLIFSLNHLFEWYVKDKNIPEKKMRLCIKTFFPYERDESIGIEEVKKILNGRNQPHPNTNQFLIRKVCNNAKHYLRRDNAPVQSSEEEITSTVDNMWAGGANAYANFHEIVYFVKYKGEQFKIEDIITNLLNEWDEFLAEDEIR